jgi:hypothetical protein
MNQLVKEAGRTGFNNADEKNKNKLHKTKVFKKGGGGHQGKTKGDGFGSIDG